MNTTRREDSPVETNVVEPPVPEVWEWVTNLPAVVFNTVFAVLAIVIFGIVFIMKPKVLMHGTAPWMWLTLLMMIVPAQIYAQFLSWSTVLAGKAPSGLAIAMRQREIPGLLRPAVALLWLCNFCIGFGIVVSLSKPHPGRPALSLAAVMVVVLIGFWLSFAANVYLLLAVRTLTSNASVLHRIWRLRLWIDAAMAIFGMIYYRL